MKSDKLARVSFEAASVWAHICKFENEKEMGGVELERSDTFVVHSSSLREARGFISHN